jgi:cellulose synthase/poly-beta-1,6-N-acetylglucosamine synthase-like glycosyltransferase
MTYLVDVLFLSYFVFLNGSQLVLFVLSALEIVRRRASHVPELDATALAADSTPPVTIIAPAYNEEEDIFDSVRGYLQLEYPHLQVIVVNDDSSDDTFRLLEQRFSLQPMNVVVHERIKTRAIRGIYESRVDPRLIVVDKMRGGKADALNAGLNLCRTPLVCCVDSDSILERSGLLRLVEPIVHDDRNTIAVGGTIRLANGCKIDDGVVQSYGMPDNWLARFQAVEYLRAFLYGRMGFNRPGGNLIVSGAFGLFVREAIVEIGGYKRDTVGEDMELTVRLHASMRDREIPYRIEQIPEPVCFTEAPEKITMLGRQRDRWQRGLFESLWLHRKMMFNPRYGWTGMVVMPFYLFFELLGPIVELSGYIWFAVTLATGTADLQFALLFTFAAFVWGFFLSVQTLVLDQMYTNMYLDWKSRVIFLIAALFENFGYRQLTLFFRIRGFFGFILGQKSWGQMVRKGYARTRQ